MPACAQRQAWLPSSANLQPHSARADVCNTPAAATAAPVPWLTACTHTCLPAPNRCAPTAPAAAAACASLPTMSTSCGGQRSTRRCSTSSCTRAWWQVRGAAPAARDTKGLPGSGNATRCVPCVHIRRCCVPAWHAAGCRAPICACANRCRPSLRPADARALQQQQLAQALSGILGGSVPSMPAGGPASLEPLMSVQVRERGACLLRQVQGRGIALVTHGWWLAAGLLLVLP